MKEWKGEWFRVKVLSQDLSLLFINYVIYVYNLVRNGSKLLCRALRFSAFHQVFLL